MKCRVLILALILAVASFADDLSQLYEKAYFLETVLRAFGEPRKYVFGQETFTKASLPNVYIMFYPEQFAILMNNGRVEEFRFEKSKAYAVQGIQNGITLQDALKILGQPKKMIKTGEIDWQEDTLYLTTSGKWKGHAYIAKNGLRLFFRQDVLFSLYVTDNTILPGK